MHPSLVEWIMWKEGLPRLYDDLKSAPAHIGVAFQHLCITVGKGNIDNMPQQNAQYDKLVNQAYEAANSCFKPMKF